jgi:hypothetical protein
MREIGKGAREVLSVHTGINAVNRSVELRQVSIKSFLTKSAVETDSEDSEGEPRPRRRRRVVRRSKFANPTHMDTSSSSEEEGNIEKRVKLKNPIPTIRVIKEYLTNRVMLGGGVGRVSYWEWKAG